VQASASFVLVLLGGIAIGLAVGLAGQWLLARIRDTAIAVMITLLAPYAAYLPAETVGVSGVLAAVVGGLLAQPGAARSSSDVRVVATAAWQMVLFLLNGLVFMLIGLQLPSVVRGLGDFDAFWGIRRPSFSRSWWRALVWVFPASYLPRLIPAVRRADPSPPWRAVLMVGWSGLRGVVTLAAALALPLDFPERSFILFVAFAVILATLVGQGLTLPLVIKKLGLAIRGRRGATTRCTPAVSRPRPRSRGSRSCGRSGRGTSS